MFLVQQITDDAFQQQVIILSDGSSLTLQIYFRPLQQGWFITSLTYGTFTLQGMRITNNTNMLHPWRNLLPFGLACYSTASREPSQSQDFSSGASNLYILTAAEVAANTAFLEAGPDGVS